MYKKYCYLGLMLVFLFLLSESLLSDEKKIGFQQTGWLQKKGVESDKNIAINPVDGSISLSDDPTKFKIACDVRDLAQRVNQIWDFAIFKNELYALACDRPMEIGGGALLKFDGDKWSQIYDFRGQDDGVFRMYAGKDNIYIAGADSAKETFGHVYIYNGEKMETTLVEFPDYMTEHNIAVAYFQNSIYVANALKRPGATPARIFRSDNDGKKWTEESVRGDNWHPNALFVSKKGLYAAVGQVMLLKDKKRRWRRVSLHGQVLTFEEHQNLIYAGGDGIIWVSNSGGTRFSKSIKMDKNTVWYLKSHNGALYAACGERITPPQYYAAPGAEYKPPDGQNDAAVWTLGKNKKWNKLVDLQEDRALSLASFQGKLFVGTGNQGKIYASGYQSEGTLVGRPIKYQNYKNIVWEGKQPYGTAIKFQLRFGKDITELKKKPFMGPDETGKSFYKKSGEVLKGVTADDKLLQYQIILDGDPEQKYTPILSKISFE